MKKTPRTRRLASILGLSTFGLLAALSLSGTASADGVPPLYPVQGVLAGPSGIPVSGPHDVAFRLHGEAEGGTALYQETHADLVVDNGSFLAYLGGGTPSGPALTAATFETHQDLWLEVAIDGEVITPRFRYGTVPYAAVAGKAELSADAQRLGGSLPNAYRYSAGVGLNLSGTGNVFSVADRGITSEKLATGIAVQASTLSTTGAATLASATVAGDLGVGGALDVSGATTLAGTTASTLTTTGAATLSSGTVSGTFRVNGATTLAGTTASTLNVTGGTTLGGTLNVTGLTSVGTFTASGPSAITALSATTVSTTGAATLASASVTGNLDVNGTALVGWRRKDCDNATSCTCDLAGEKLLSGGAIGHVTDATLAVQRFVYAQRATSDTTFGALCATTAGGACGRITVVCARVGN